MQPSPKITPVTDETQDIHHIFKVAFNDAAYYRQRDKLPPDVDHCLSEGIAACEKAGWVFGGPDKVIVDSAWFDRLLHLTTSPHHVLGDRLQHLLTMRAALGEYREHVQVMGKHYFLPPEIVALLRRNAE